MSYDSPLKCTSEREQYLLLSQQLRKLEDMFDLQQSDHQHLLRSIEDLQAKILSLTDENQRLRSELAEVDAVSAEQKAEISSLHAALEKKKSAAARYREELKSATLANAKAVGEQHSLQDQIVRLNQDQEKLLRDYEALMDQCDKVTELLDQQTAANGRLKADVGSADAKLAEAVREVEAMARRTQDAEYLMRAVQMKYEAATLTIKDLKHEVDSAREMALQAQEDVHRLQSAKETIQCQLQSDGRNLEFSIADLRQVIARKDEEIQSLLLKCQLQQSTLQGSGKLQSQVSEMVKALEAKDTVIDSRERDLKVLEQENRQFAEENRMLQKQLRMQTNQVEKLTMEIDSLKQQMRAMSRSEEGLKRYLQKKERMLDMRAKAEADLRSAIESVDLSAKRLV